MSDLFTRMCCRMDGATVRVMGKQAEINGVVYDVMPEEESAEMGRFRAASCHWWCFQPGTVRPVMMLLCLRGAH